MYRFHPWVRRIPWRRKRQPSPVGGGAGRAALHAVRDSDTAGAEPCQP